MLLVDGDHEPAGVGLFRDGSLAGGRAPGRARSRSSRRRGSARCAAGSTPDRGPARPRSWPQHVARWGAPLHLAVDTREVHRSDDAAVAERIGVAVGVVGVGEIALGRDVVADERDLRRCRCGTGVPDSDSRSMRARTRAGSRRPTPVRGRRGGSRRGSRSPSAAKPAQLVGSRPGRDLLIGRDEAVHVAGETLTRRPVGIELQAHPVGGERPLDLQVARRRDHDETASLVGERGACAREGERRLAGPGRRDGEEIRCVARRGTDRTRRAARGGG